MLLPSSIAPRLRARIAGSGPGAALPDGPALRAGQSLRTPSRLPGILRLFGLFAAFGASHFTASAGDLLRGGAPAGTRGVPNSAAQSAGAAEAARARANAKDILSRTNRALQSVQDMQKAARAAALNGPDNLGRNPNNPTQTLPNVPNGLTVGGLEVAPGVGVDPSLWRGAGLPTQFASDGRTKVQIVQTQSQAVLNWRTFNIGKKTTVVFNQELGGAQKGQWIVFNKIQDPSGAPSQILGNIEAGGQVYVINQNGILFGGSSQISTRSFTASSLPINDNLIQRGLLNQTASSAEFLFSTTSQGAFTPPAAPPNGRYGDVVVQRGALIASPPSVDGGGGRVVLAGPNVRNEGTIETPAGQSILAAGLQVGLQAHPGSDPSLRGLDVYVGDVGTYGGLSKNEGLINIPTGSLVMAGKQIEQNGVVDSLTTVTLNGRVDLLANYDAVANRDFNPSNAGPAFLHRSTGSVRFGGESVTRILPDTTSGQTTVGSSLPINSEINIQGLSVYLGPNATLLAPSAEVSIQAGRWRPVVATLTDGLLKGTGDNAYEYSTGQIYLDGGASINVAGSTDVAVPLSNYILELQLRSNELSVAPLQRTGLIRGVSLTVDLRRTGRYNGRLWTGTPLGDASGFADIVQRDAGQLTAKGGTVTMQAGQGFVAQNGSVIDVSGGYFVNQGGLVQTTRLRAGSTIFDIASATPDRVYDGIYEGTWTKVSPKWGITEIYQQPLAPMGATMQPEYISGAAGGSLRITAPGMAIDGELLGQTIAGSRQIRATATSSEMPDASALQLTFKNQDAGVFGNNLLFPERSPTPPKIILGANLELATVGAFSPDTLVPLPQERLQKFAFSPDFFAESGFGSLTLQNPDGDFEVPSGVRIDLPAAGALSVTGRNIHLFGSIKAPGGRLSFTAYNLSPFEAAIQRAEPQAEAPPLDKTVGTIALGSSSVLDVAGLIVDDRFSASAIMLQPLVTGGGQISLAGYNVELPAGSLLDASGGVAVTARATFAYGAGGSIGIRAGQDPNLASILGGKLTLLGELRGYSGATGGSLSIKAPLIQVGGAPLHPDALVLNPDFFNQGGFTQFNLTGIGVLPDGTIPSDPDAPAPFLPAVWIAPGTVVEPRVESYVYVPHQAGGRGAGFRRIVLPDGLRPAVSLGFYAGPVTRDFVDLAAGGQRGDLLIRGDVLLAERSAIRTDPGAAVIVDAQTVTVLGSVDAPAGSIQINGAASFPLPPRVAASFARPTVHLGPNASLSAAGTVVLTPDAYGRRTGTVRDGGTIAISGNILAEAGAVLDVSGSSGILDVHPSQMGVGQATQVPLNSGLNSPLYRLRTLPIRVDSDGGFLELDGTQMLLSDATLLGAAGGPTAMGGTLSISSGQFYADGASQFGSDINLVVTQSGLTIPRTSATLGIGRPIRDAQGTPVTGGGFFAADRFIAGGFDSLDLGFAPSRTGQSRGGNVEFRGPVSITARGSLRVASGGIIRADAPVVFTAPYVAIGQEFQTPESPDAEPFLPFVKLENNASAQEFVRPEFGAGSLTISARVLDVGTVVLKNIGQASLNAPGGDIRGNGTLSIQGDLSLTAANIYPTTLSTFNLFAYDPAGGLGSVSIHRAGPSVAPLSAGGSLNIYASQITQAGVLSAPFGSIVLGWDGTDLDPADADIDGPLSPTAGTTLAAPVAQRVVLAPGSLTTVAGNDFDSGVELLVPYGLSPTGQALIDPRGVDVTASGLPQKRIVIAGNSVETQAGSTIDLRGGGDLFAYRWVAGNGGPVDLLGSASGEWSASTNYAAGDLVSFGGQTWSARVAIDPTTFGSGSGPRPAINRYWSLVPESYAVLPGYRSPVAPYASFGTATTASALGGDRGYVGTNLKIGDQIYLDGGSGLESGVYTLLPRRYALLPGAFVVTPQSSGPLGTYTIPEGSTFTTGYRSNGLNQPAQTSPLRSLIEVVPAEVFAQRAAYELYSVNAFAQEAAERLDINSVQRLPMDSGYLSLQGNTGLTLNGRVLSRPLADGRGAAIDVSSFADIVIGDGTGAAPGTVVLDAGTLSGFGAESLLIGGVRRFATTGTTVEVRTQNLTLNNAGSPLSGPEITLVANGELTLSPGAELLATGANTEPSQTLFLTGPGTAVRVGQSTAAEIVRTGVTASALPKLTIGAGATIGGAAVVLDSTYGFDLDPDLNLEATSLTLAAGQISLLLEGPTPLTGQLIDPQLVLSGPVLADIQQGSSLSLLSYQNTIDIYGVGDFGGTLSELSLEAGEIRGFNQGAGSATFTAGAIVLGNSRNVAAPGPLGAPSGSLVFNADIVTIGSGNLNISQYADVIFNATGGIQFTGAGGLFAQQNLTANTPRLVGAQGANQNFVAGGTLIINDSGTGAGITGGLGASLLLRGMEVTVNSDVLLPSGLLEVRATTGDVIIGGFLDARGSALEFYDVTRFADAGEIRLVSENGGVSLLASSQVSVTAAAGGGNAGMIAISAERGQFSALGQFEGQKGTGGRGGSFELDTESIGSFTALTDLLNAGGFDESRNLRVRTGDLIVSGTTTVRNFVLSADGGSINVTGTIDGRGVTGGTIELIARDNLVLEAGAVLTVAAEQFSNAGKGGEIRLGAGAAVNGTPNLASLLDLQAGATIDLAVAEYVAGDYTTPGSSAFFGAFQGTLHLRAPRTAGNNDLLISALDSTILGASNIVAEGYQVFDLTASGGLITGWRSAIATLPTAGTVQRAVYDSASSFLSAGNEAAMTARLLGADPQALSSLLVITPGTEIINTNGDLTLGLSNAQILALSGNSATAVTSLGSATINSADWNLSDFRFGTKAAPGVLTLRASGDLVFNNALSDGFNPIAASTANGNSGLWLGQLRDIDTRLPLNNQSWSYRLTAGADLGAAGYAQTLSATNLAAGKGSIFVGEFYDTVPNSSTSGATVAIGANGLTANALRISPTISGTVRERGTRYEVIRTGTGSITINAGRDVQLRNQFATIYTAGVRIPTAQAQSIYTTNDFRLPAFYFSSSGEPVNPALGAAQQFYGPTFTDEAGAIRRTGQWSLAGGNIAISAAANIAHYSGLDAFGQPILDSSRQSPSNWLYRRGAVDPGTGLVSAVTIDALTNVVDPAASTTWWIDFSNFFEGIGTLGGGDVRLSAGNDVLNVDAVAATNARMPGRDTSGNNVAPDESRLLELGGGDVTVRAGNDINGGIYYVERGTGILNAGGEITTNETRSPSFGDLRGGQEIFDERTWLPTTLFLGKGGFTVSARQDVLLGPVLNAFLQPQGLGNKTWYRTFFSTYSSDASVDVASFGGSVTHRLAATLPGLSSAQPIFSTWLNTQNKFNSATISPVAPQGDSAAYFQPWIRLAETSLDAFATTTTISAPTLRSTAFAGDLNVVGNLNLSPSATGTLELLASDSIIGLQSTGVGRTTSGITADAWVTARINVSDAAPSSINGVATPSGRNIETELLRATFSETGSFSGANASAAVQNALHSPGPLHASDSSPVRLYAGGGDLESLTLYLPKQAQILAEQDISNIAFYLQNASEESVTIVSAGRDVIPYNADSPTRIVANDLSRGNFIVDQPQATVLLQGGTSVTTTALSGDIQLGGAGILEVLAGRNIDLGSGANLLDGRGVGITTIGQARNPFLPFSGADLVLIAGISGENGGPAVGLAGSNLEFDSSEVIMTGNSLAATTPELQALASLAEVYAVLQQSAVDFSTTGNYDAGFAVIASVFGTTSATSQIFTQARDIRTTSGGSISIAVPGGGLSMATDIFGNPLTPPGIVTEFGGPISIFTLGDLSIGQARIFTLRGGDLTIWSSAGDIAAGSAPKTVVSAPPTRVVIDATSAEVQTDLAGLATGGGIGVLASVQGVEPGRVTLIAPGGAVDAGDAGIRATGDITIAAVTVINADNIAAGGTSTGVPSAPTVAAPNISGLTAASNTAAAGASAASGVANQPPPAEPLEETPSIISVEVLGYGGGSGAPGSEEDEEERRRREAAQ